MSFSPLRRFLFVSTASVVLGIATTVAVAWAFGALANPPLPGRSGAMLRDDTVFTSWELLGPGLSWIKTDTSSVASAVDSLIAERVHSLHLARIDDDNRGNVFDDPPSWSHFANDPARVLDVRYPTEGAEELAMGWPFHAFRCWREATVVTPTGKPEIRGGISIDDYTRTPATGPVTWRALAYVPIWPGFALDVSIYTALWLVLVLGSAGLVRLVRLARSRCPACGYHLPDATHGCPECGRGRPEPA